MTFRQAILERLHQRNQREHALHDIIDANQRLLDKVIALQKRNQDLKLTHSISSQEALSVNHQQMLDLDKKIRELHEERAEMYKTQSENAQRLVTMNDQLRKKEETEKKQTEELQKLSESCKKLSAKCEAQTHQLREKDVAIQILQDELSALQLEMVTTEERSKNLEVENAQLLQRWLDKMNEEADKMNEATKFYESFLEQARSVGQIIRKSGGQWVMHPANKGGEQDKPLSTIVLPSQVFKRISAHDGEIHCIQAASTGKYFATGGSDKKVKVFSPNSGQLLQTLTGALQTITSISFSPNDDLILGSSTDNATRIWSLGNGRIKHTLTGHIGKVYAAKFCSGANRVVSGSHDRTLKVWDLQKAYCIRTIFTFSSCNDLCLMDSDGQTIVSGHFDNNIRLWDARTGNGIKQLTGLHTGQITSVSMSPDGSTVLTNSRDNTLKTIDLRMYEVLQSFQAESYHSGLNWSRACYSPDGHFVTAGSTDGIVHIWNAQSGLLEKAVAGHKSSICGVAWNPTGNFLYSADKNRTICLWETAVGQS